MRFNTLHCIMLFSRGHVGYIVKRVVRKRCAYKFVRLIAKSTSLIAGRPGSKTSLQNLNVLRMARSPIIVNLFSILHVFGRVRLCLHLFTWEVVSPLSLLRSVTFIWFQLVGRPCCEIDPDSVHISQSILIKVIWVNIAKIGSNLHSTPVGSVPCTWFPSTFKPVELNLIIGLLLLVAHSFVIHWLLRVWEAKSQVADLLLQGYWSEHIIANHCWFMILLL